jgi:hypothetical protein
LSAIEITIKNWEREGINLHPPAAKEVVTAALSKISRPYSRDVVALYCATGGMKEGESDSHMWELWSIERLVSENSGYGRPHILFADFLINSHLYVSSMKMKRSRLCVWIISMVRSRNL